MKRNRFKPIEIHANDPSDIFESHRMEISSAIINGIEFGLRNKKKKVDFARIVVRGMIVITLTIDSKEFLDLLDENVKTLVEYEEYEMCALAMKLKNKINKSNEKVTEKNRILD
jgi:hypothetical protein